MSSYSPERKAALLKKLLPPMNLSVAELARQEGIPVMTLYAWRTKLRAGGARTQPMIGRPKPSLRRCCTLPHALYQQARNQHPHRWSGATRNWQPIGTVTLNPEKEQPALKKAA